MKNIKFAKRLIQLNILFWIIYNTYFGWNFDAISELEKNCDTIFIVTIKVSIAIYLMPLLSLYEKTIEAFTKINNQKKQQEQ
jgi:hypothetical protein